VFREQVVPAAALERSLLAFADHAATAGLDADGPYRAASDLLCGRRVGDATVRLCRELDGGVFPIQGPPGSGKTYVGARAIVALATSGRRVGVTMVSHKVIDNLPAEVQRAADEAGVTLHVATSRARGVVIVVASPRPFEAECLTPAQTRMVNGLCRFRELARAVEHPPA